MTIEYAPAAGQYRDTKTKRFVSRSQVLLSIEQEKNKLQLQLKKIGEDFLGNRIDLERLQIRMVEALKNFSVQGAMIGGGGAANTTNEIYGATGRRLRNRYNNLRNFAEDILKGEMSDAQFMNRIQQYAETYRAVFYDSERRTKRNGGFNQAKRWLDPTSEHCDDCLKLHTNGQWKPIGEVVPPGTRCVCRGRCRCFIAYRRFFDSDITKRILK